MLRKLYNRAIDFSGRRNAIWVLAVVSFLEAWIFPIPPDALLIPMALAAPNRAFLIAAVCLVTSVLGGLCGYFIGAVLYQQVGFPILEHLNAQRHVDEFFATYNRYGAWSVFIAGFTPIPYKAVTILSGAASLSINVFVVSSIAGRGARFFLLAWLLWRYGDSFRLFIERRITIFFWVLICAIVGFFVVARI